MAYPTKKCIIIIIISVNLSATKNRFNLYRELKLNGLITEALIYKNKFYLIIILNGSPIFQTLIEPNRSRNKLKN